jgi:hypothetical protein
LVRLNLPREANVEGLVTNPDWLLRKQRWSVINKVLFDHHAGLILRKVCPKNPSIITCVTTLLLLTLVAEFLNCSVRHS